MAKETTQATIKKLSAFKAPALLLWRAVVWVWKNRVNLFIAAFFTILMAKWLGGRITTQQVIDALQLINPVNLLSA